ncbi:MAG: T9SS type A sorting domain-containing protein [Bacteroidales bacterium]|nr:T9SS type A sorting domain-containing protein [Bacteroidales bacterium]
MKHLLIFCGLMISLSTFSQNFVELDINLPTMSDSSGSVEWGDYDADGDLDLLIAQKNNDTVKIFKNIGNDEFIDANVNIIEDGFVFSASWGFYNSDTLLDILVIKEDSAILYVNVDNMNFNRIQTNITGYISNRNFFVLSKWGDFDNDGDNDILLDCAIDSIIIYKCDAGNYSSIFSNSFDGEDLVRSKWGDFDNDGDLDLLTKTYYDGNRYLELYMYDNGNYQFVLRNQENGFYDWIDFDNDNDLDIIVLGYYYNHAKIINNNDNTFNNWDDTTGIFLYHSNRHNNFDIIDLNNDGWDDFVIPGYKFTNASPKIFINNKDQTFKVIDTGIEAFTYIGSVKCGDYDSDGDIDFLYYGVSEDIENIRIIKNNYNNTMSLSQDSICNNEVLNIEFNSLNDNVLTNWNFDGGIIKSGINSGPYEILWNSIGEKEITLVYSYDSINWDTVISQIYVLSTPIATLPSDTIICSGESVQLHSIVSGDYPPFEYNWNNSATTSSIDVTPAENTYYSIDVTDHNGCHAYDTSIINIQAAYENEEICMVTVDSATKKNMVIWEKTPDQGTEAYYIYKESTVGGVYNLIGEEGFDTAGVFIDESSNPNQHFDRYKIQTKDTCGNLSELSDYHQSIYLSISQGLPGNYNLEWTPYVGFEYGTYKIYKGYTEDNFTLIQELANTHTSYTDTASGIAYYQVEVERSSPCITDTKKSFSYRSRISSSSNVEDTKRFLNVKPSEVLTNLQIYPVPFKDELTINYTLKNASELKIGLYNSIGIEIAEIANEYTLEGHHTKSMSKQISSISDGIYFLKIEVNDNIMIYKIVKTN